MPAPADLQSKAAGSLSMVAWTLLLLLCLSATSAAAAEDISLPNLSGCQDYTKDIAFVGPQLSTPAGPLPSISYHRFGPFANITSSASPQPPSRPLVLINGYGANMYVWSIPLLKALAQNREVIMFNSPGVGNSSFHSDIGPSKNFTVTQLADHVVDFIAALQLPQAPDLLGWSLGGTTALAIITRHASAVNNVIVVSGSAGGPLTPVAGLVTAMIPAATAVFASNATLLLESLLPPGLRQPAACNILASVVAFESLGALKAIPIPVLTNYATANQLLSCDNQIYAALPNVTVNRVMFVHGQQDTIVPITAALAAARQVPGAWQVVYSNTGHVLAQSYPERVAAVVDAFLGTVDKMTPQAAAFSNGGKLPNCQSH